MRCCVPALNPGRVFGRQQLMTRIFPEERVIADRTIDSRIEKLPKKISADESGRDLIHTGY